MAMFKKQISVVFFGLFYLEKHLLQSEIKTKALHAQK